MEEITPKHLRCAIQVSCPAVFDDGDDLVIIGKIVESFVHRSRIGPWEQAIRIPKAFFAKAEEVVSDPRDHLAPYRKCIQEDIL